MKYTAYYLDAKTRRQCKFHMHEESKDAAYRMASGALRFRKIRYKNLVILEFDTESESN